MLELSNLEMINGKCNECVYCIIHKLRECEWDMFEPIEASKSKMYMAVDFDCLHFTQRG